ncbi:hypothetical protein D3C81_2268660 [compost metagenome]
MLQGHGAADFQLGEHVGATAEIVHFALLGLESLEAGGQPALDAVDVDRSGGHGTDAAHQHGQHQRRQLC